MEFRLVILTLACFSCAMPPALGMLLTGKALVAAGAIKGAALLGAKALAGKALAKGALAAKGLLVSKGAAALAAKGAAVKGAAVLAAKAVAKGAAWHFAKPLPRPMVVVKPIPPPPPPHYKPCATPALVPVHSLVAVPKLPSLADKMSSLLGSVQSAVQTKSNAVSHVLRTLREKVAPAPVVYEIVKPQRTGFYPVPVIQKMDAVYEY